VAEKGLVLCMLQQVYSFLDEERNHEDHKTADMFVMCILSHGEDKHFYSSDGGRIKIKDIMNRFDGQNCPALNGKPKLFFVQACQGGRFSTLYIYTIIYTILG